MKVSNLIRHKKIHFRFKPYICEICNKNFSSSSNLNQHKNTHYLKKNRSKYVCFVDDCMKSYLYICTLKKHVLSCHTENYNQITDIFSDKNFTHFYENNKKRRLLEENFDFVNFKNKKSIDEDNDNLDKENSIQNIFEDIKIENGLSSLSEQNNLLIEENEKDFSEMIRIDHCSDSEVKSDSKSLNNKDDPFQNNPNKLFDSNERNENFFPDKFKYLTSLSLEILGKFSFLKNLEVVFDEHTNTFYKMVKKLNTEK